MSDRKPSRIPVGRLERLGRVGWMAGEAVLGGLFERARRRLASSKDDDESPSLLSPQTATRLARRLAGMRGAAMKLGQMLSLEGEDLLPPEVARAFGRLRADADAMPRAQLQRVLEEEWSPDWRLRLRHFDFEPIAAASIGQVHRAVSLAGEPLALKIQYPGVARSIDSDVDNLGAALRLSRLLPRDLDLSGLLEETKRQLHAEADYLQEAQHLMRYAELLRDDPRLHVPRVHPELTTARILAMDYLAGEPLERLCSPERSAEDRSAAASALYEILFRELFEFRFMQTDPNFANYLWLEDGRLGLVDLGAARSIEPELAERYRELFRAALERDARQIHRAALAIGLLDRSERRDRRDALVGLLELACEPFRHEGAYDFGTSDLAERLRHRMLELTLRQGFWRPPPASVLFLHRKLGGTFLLSARLRARVDVAALLAPHLRETRPQAVPPPAPAPEEAPAS